MQTFIVSRALFKNLIAAMGFQRDETEAREVWTNPHGPLSQVWIILSVAQVLEGQAGYSDVTTGHDASGSEIDFAEFYRWLHEQDAEARRSDCDSPLEE